MDQLKRVRSAENLLGIYCFDTRRHSISTRATPPASSIRLSLLTLHKVGAQCPRAKRCRGELFGVLLASTDRLIPKES